jgi:hypothetical protein
MAFFTGITTSYLLNTPNVASAVQKYVLWAKARSAGNLGLKPSLDLDFAGNKSLVDNVTGSNLVTFTRASSGTFVGSDGVLQTAATDVPRFDHNPTTGESLGLLVEEQRANSIRNNTGVGAVAGTPGTPPTNWTLGIASSMDLNIIGTGTENGVSYIDVQYTGTASGTSSSSVAFETNTGIAGATGQTWTASAYIKVVGGSTTGISLIRLGWEERSGSFVTAKNSSGLTLATSGNLITTRQAHTATNDGGATIAYVKPYVILTPNNGAAIDITLRIGLPQLEQGAFATSVIPTSTTAVTRSADVASIMGIDTASWYNHLEGTICTAVSYQGGNVASNGFGYSNGVLKFAEAGLSNFSRVIRLATQNTPNSHTMVQRNSTSSYTANENTIGDLQVGRVYRYSGSYVDNSTSGLAFVVDGGTVRTNSTAAAIPQATRLLIGRGNSGTVEGSPDSDNQYCNGTIRRLTYWPTRLPNSTLQAVTQ